MNKLRLYGIWSIVITLMFFILISSAIGAEKEPIKIGVIVELTGDAAEMGIENKRTIDVAVDLLNAKGGIKGYPVQAIIVDGQSNPAVFATKAHRLLEAFKVLGGIGGNDISYATAAGEVFQDAKTPFLDIGGTTATIPLVGDYMFMSPVPDNDQGRAVAKYIYEKLGYDKVAIFKDVGSAYGTKLTEYIIYFLKEFSGKENPVPLVLEYNTGDSDYTAQLTRLKTNINKLEIQAIILPTWPQDAPKIAKQARELDINLPLVGTDGVDTSALIEVGGEAVEGMIYSTHFSASQPGLSPFAQEFVEEYIKKEGEEPGAFGTMGYDAFMILAETISSLIEDKGEEWWDSTSLADKRMAIKDELMKIETTWTTQPIKFVGEGWPQRGIVWKVVKNGVQSFYDFQTYESYTPEGIETFPFM
jgi:branched-chain amino acid transport system substrate-binding protein